MVPERAATHPTVPPTPGGDVMALAFPGGPREAASLLAFLVALLFAGAYNGPLEELPLLLWCAGSAVLWAWLTPVRVTEGPATVLACLAIVWCIVAWRASASPSISLAPTVSLLLVPLAALVAASAARVGPLLVVALTGGTVLVLLGWRDLLTDTLRTPTGLLDPNNIASLLNMLWPPAVAGLLVRLRSSDVPVAVPLCVALGGILVTAILLATGSRAGLVLAAVMVLVLAVVAARQRLQSIGAVLLLVPLLAWGASQVIVLPTARDAGLVPVSAAAIPADTAATALSLRASLARASLELWADAPLTGTGPQTFHLLYPSVRDEGEQLTAGYFAHNDWVQLPQELGLPGAVALLGVFAWLAMRGLGLLALLLRHPGEAASRTAELGLILASGSALVHAAVNFTLYVAPIGLLFGLALGVLARPTAPARERSRPVRLAGLGLASAMLLPLSVDAVSAAALMGHSGFPGLAATTTPRSGLARTLLALAPDDSVPPLYLAGVHRVRAGAAQDVAGRDYALALAVQYYETALARDPWNTGVHLAYAELATSLGGSVPLSDGSTRTDLELLAEARRRAPLSSGPVIALGRLHAARGALEEERALLADWLRYCRLVQRYEAGAAAVVIDRARAIGVGEDRLGVCYAVATGRSGS